MKTSTSNALQALKNTFEGPKTRIRKTIQRGGQRSAGCRRNGITTASSPCATHFQVLRIRQHQDSLEKSNKPFSLLTDGERFIEEYREGKMTRLREKASATKSVTSRLRINSTEIGHHYIGKINKSTM